LSYIVKAMRLWRTIKNYLLPWHGNAHRPRVLRRQWLVALLGLALLSEAVILSGSVFTDGPNVFLAAVVRSDVFNYTVQARTHEGGQALSENDVLTAAAQAKAEDMAAREYFSHTGPSGEEPWTWLTNAGYSYQYAGENLAVRFTDSKKIVDAWMASPGHRANIVKPKYTEMGVGLAEGTYKGKPATYVVQFFGTPKAVAAASVPTVSVVPEAAGDVAAATVAPAPTPAPQDTFMQSVLRTIGTTLGESRTAAAWALGGIAAFLAAILALTFFVRIQVQPTDLLVPGLAVAMVAVLFMGVNAKFLPETMSQSAGVAMYESGGEIGAPAQVETATTFPEVPER
jgi:hypothetical protein